MKRNRIGVIVFALLGMAIVFAVSFMVLQRQAPEGVRVLVAAQDIAVGSTLTADMLRYDVVNASPQTLAALLPQTDEAQVLGKVLIRDVSVGQPLTWTLFGDAANPDAASRVALTYGPDFVAMVVPFSALFVPDRILPGDRVDLLMSVPANLGATGARSIQPWRTPASRRAACTRPACSRPRYRLRPRPPPRR